MRSTMFIPTRDAPASAPLPLDFLRHTNLIANADSRALGAFYTETKHAKADSFMFAERDFLYYWC